MNISHSQGNDNVSILLPFLNEDVYYGISSTGFTTVQ